MWFRNLVVYRLPQGWTDSGAALEDQLARRVLMPCGPLEMSSRGWVPPSATGALVHSVNGQDLIALGVNQKLLPSSVIRQEAAERSMALAAEQGFPVGRRQMRELRARVADELRARALSRRRVTRAWLDVANGWFVVDSASAKRAEELVETLRETLGSFAVTLVTTERSAGASMGAWLTRGEAPSSFSLDVGLELGASDGSGGSIRYSGVEADIAEVRKRLSTGMSVKGMGLTWRDRVSFMLTESLLLKKIEFVGMKRETPSGVGGDEINSDEEFDLEFALMAGELAPVLSGLVAALGGEAKQEPAEAQQAA